MPKRPATRRGGTASCPKKSVSAHCRDVKASDGRRPAPAVSPHRHRQAGRAGRVPHRRPRAAPDARPRVLARTGAMSPSVCPAAGPPNGPRPPSPRRRPGIRRCGGVSRLVEAPAEARRGAGRGAAGPAACSPSASFMDTAGSARLHALVVMGADTDTMDIPDITAHPTAPPAAQLARGLLADLGEGASSHLSRDRGSRCARFLDAFPHRRLRDPEEYAHAPE